MHGAFGAQATSADAAHEHEAEALVVVSPIAIEPTAVDWLVEGIVAVGMLAVLFGAPKTMKSIFALGIALAVATGKEVGGIKASRPRRVLIHNPEDYTTTNPGGILVQRVHGLVEGHQLDRRVVESNLKVLNRDRVSLSDDDDLAQLGHVASSYDLVILDPLVDHHDAEENDAGEMARVMSAARSLQTVGPTVLLVHHTPKDGRSTPRGSSAIMGALGTSIELSASSGQDPSSPRDVKIFHRGAPSPPIHSFSAQLENEDQMLRRAVLEVTPNVSSSKAGKEATRDVRVRRTRDAILIALHGLGIALSKGQIYEVVRPPNARTARISNTKSEILDIVDQLVSEGKVHEREQVHGGNRRGAHYLPAEPPPDFGNDDHLREVHVRACNVVEESRPVFAEITNALREQGGAGKNKTVIAGAIARLRDGDDGLFGASLGKKDAKIVYEAIERMCALGHLEADETENADGYTYLTNFRLPGAAENVR